MNGLVLALRFALELALLAALAAAGLALRWPQPWPIVAAVLLPIAAAAAWGTWIAPKAPHRVDDPGRIGLELVMFSLGVVGLLVAGRPWLAATFGALVVAHLVAMIGLGLRGH